MPMPSPNTREGKPVKTIPCPCSTFSRLLYKYGTIILGNMIIILGTMEAPPTWLLINSLNLHELQVACFRKIIRIIGLKMVLVPETQLRLLKGWRVLCISLRNGDGGGQNKNPQKNTHTQTRQLVSFFPRTPSPKSCRGGIAKESTFSFLCLVNLVESKYLSMPTSTSL